MMCLFQMLHIVLSSFFGAMKIRQITISRILVIPKKRSVEWPHKPNLQSVEFTIRRIHDSPNQFYTETGFKEREKLIKYDL